MRKAVFLAMSVVLFVPVLSLSGINTIGVDYVADSDTLVYGGSRYYSRSQSPEDSRTLYTARLNSDSRSVLYTSQAASLNDIKAAPQGNLVGALELVFEANVGEGRANYVTHRIDESGNEIPRYYFEDSRLLILNTDGDVIASISGVRRYAWNPNGRRIAYITGSYYEGGHGFSTTGSWIL